MANGNGPEQRPNQPDPQSILSPLGQPTSVEQDPLFHALRAMRSQSLGARSEGLRTALEDPRFRSVLDSIKNAPENRAQLPAGGQFRPSIDAAKAVGLASDLLFQQFQQMRRQEEQRRMQQIFQALVKNPPTARQDATAVQNGGR